MSPRHGTTLPLSRGRFSPHEAVEQGTRSMHDRVTPSTGDRTDLLAIFHGAAAPALIAIGQHGRCRQEIQQGAS